MSLDISKDKINFTGADDLLEQLFKMSMNRRMIFRGIKFDEEIYPKIMRVRYLNSNNDLSPHEDKFLEEFMKYGCSLVDGNLNPIDLVGYAQHFGLPTRLIDWTYNPFIALFFAINGVYNPEIDTYKLLVMDISEQITLQKIFYRRDIKDLGYSAVDLGINEYMYFKHTISDSSEFIKACEQYCEEEYETENARILNMEIIKEKVCKNRFIVMTMNYSNTRIIAQQGLFVIPKSLDKEKIIEEYKQSNVRIIYIDKKLKRELLNRLDNMNINKKRLFFDIVNICDDITLRIAESDKSFEEGFR